MLIAGIDPGKSGCVAILNLDGSVLFFKCPVILNGKKKEYDERGMASIIQHVSFSKPAMIFLEKVHAMPKQGVVSMFSFGQGFGLWLGILACHDVPYELVTPQRWKRDMLSDIPGDDKKARSVMAAKRLFPVFSDWKKKDHDKAEALMIAEWGRRKISTYPGGENARTGTETCTTSDRNLHQVRSCENP